MGGIHEVAEHIEHAAHAEHGGHGGGHGGGGKSITKYVGLTMAVLGVFLALCSALVGAERTELVQTMVEQSNTFAEFQAASTKYRVVMTQLEQTYAVTPSRALTRELDGKLAEVKVPDDQTAMAGLQRDVFKDLSALLTPRKVEVESFLASVDRYNDERKAAKAWAQSYDDEVKAHAEAAESYEKAQLAAEVGIVIASIALLLTSRPLWIIALLGLAASAGTAGKTWFHTHSEVHEAREKIEHAKEHYTELREQKDANGKRIAEVHDEEIMAKIRERLSIAAPPPKADHGAAGGHGGGEPAHGAAPAKSGEPAHAAEPVKSGEPAHGAEPAKSGEPAHGATPPKSGEPAHAATPAPSVSPAHAPAGGNADPLGGRN
jgi:hypothetical protein